MPLSGNFPSFDTLKNYCYTFLTTTYVRMLGELFIVEKVKPDPLNLLVNTSVGKSFYSHNSCA